MDRGYFCSRSETFGISINQDQLIKAGTGNCSLTNLSTSDVFPFNVRLVVGLTWLVLILVGAIANIMVLIVIGFHKKMRTIANWLLFNLAIADCIMVMIAIPILAVFQTFYYPIWKLPNWSCYLVSCSTHIGALASGGSLVAISVHRFIVIRLSRKILFTKWHLIVTIIVIWIVAFGGSLSSMLNASVIGMIRPISGQLHMTRLCVQVHSNESKEDFQLAFRLSMYITFALFLFILYSNIGIFLWRSKSPGHSNAAEISDIRKRQAVKMLASATALMIITYLPYMVLVALALFAKSGYFSSVFGIEIFGNMFTTVNHVCNPFIYCAFSSQFRDGFKVVFKKVIGNSIEFSLTKIRRGITSIRRNTRRQSPEPQFKPVIKDDYLEMLPLGNKTRSQLTLKSTVENDTSAQLTDSTSSPCVTEHLPTADDSRISQEKMLKSEL